MTEFEKALHSNPHLLSYKLCSDKRIEEARQLVEAAVKDAQQKIEGIRPPRAEQKELYEKLLEDFGKIRGGALFYPYIGSGFGKGPFVELLDGSIKYDCISGIGVHCLGHLNLEIVKASFENALSDTVMQGHLQQNSESYLFSKMLQEASGLDHCFLTTSGAMANENALKIAFAARPGATRILAFERGFCGRTLALAAITDKPQNRKGLPLTLAVDYLPFYDAENPSLSTERCILKLEQLLARYPEHYAACLFELVQGEGGFYAGSHAFFSAIMQILKKANVLTIVDEIQTFGRTYELFAYNHYGVQEYVDIVTIGKLSQACATLYTTKVKPPSGLLSQTFTSSSSAIKAGIVVLQELLKGELYGKKGRNACFHHLVTKEFERLMEQGLPIQGPFGVGMMVAFTPFAGDQEKTTVLVRKLFEKGVIAFTAGQNPARVRFLFPINCLEERHLKEIFSILSETMRAI